MPRGHITNSLPYIGREGRERGFGNYDRSSRNDRNRNSDNYGARTVRGRPERFDGPGAPVDDYDDDGDYFRDYYGAGRNADSPDAH